MPDAGAMKPDGSGQFRYATRLDEWPASDDTGLSSAAIYRHFTGKWPSGYSWNIQVAHSYPLDPSDFGRCHRLLALAPEWSARIGEMGRYGKEWKALADHWPELTLAFVSIEGTDGRAMYDRMHQLIDA